MNCVRRLEYHKIIRHMYVDTLEIPIWSFKDAEVGEYFFHIFSNTLYAFSNIFTGLKFAVFLHGLIYSEDYN